MLWQRRRGRTELEDHLDERSGTFSGSGAGGPYTFPITGKIVGSSVTLTTGPYAQLPSYSATFSGTVSKSGKTMSGTWTSDESQSGTWTATLTSGGHKPKPGHRGGKKKKKKKPKHHAGKKTKKKKQAPRRQEEAWASRRQEEVRPPLTPASSRALCERSLFRDRNPPRIIRHQGTKRG